MTDESPLQRLSKLHAAATQDIDKNGRVAESELRVQIINAFVRLFPALKEQMEEWQHWLAEQIERAEKAEAQLALMHEVAEAAIEIHDAWYNQGEVSIGEGMDRLDAVLAKLDALAESPQ